MKNLSCNQIYQQLLERLEISVVRLGDLNLGNRIDAEYFSKSHLQINEILDKITTRELNEFCMLVASAFYPAATQLYSKGDTPFARCVDCVQFPIITSTQKESFEKIPYSFAKESGGINILKRHEIIITKVGTPCYASIIEDFNEVALSHTVVGLSDIKGINAYYLLIFLRSKFGFDQLLRERELTIQYQLTLDRVRSIKIYDAPLSLQNNIEKICLKSKSHIVEAAARYAEAERILLEELGLIGWQPSNDKTTIKTFSDVKRSGRIDAEYYQPKYDELQHKISQLHCKTLCGTGGLTNWMKSIEPGSEAYQDKGVPFLRVSDISKFDLQDPDIKIDEQYLDITEKLMPSKGTILLSKDGSVGIAYVVKENLKAITSSALLHLTIKDNSVILPEYLALVLNSIVVQMQAQRDASGAIIQHWKPSQIEKVIIPLLPIEKQRQIENLVSESFKLRAESKRLLEEAKRMVETSIEQATTAETTITKLGCIEEDHEIESKVLAFLAMHHQNSALEVAIFLINNFSGRYRGMSQRDWHRIAWDYLKPRAQKYKIDLSELGSQVAAENE